MDYLEIFLILFFNFRKSSSITCKVGSIQDGTIFGDGLCGGDMCFVQQKTFKNQTEFGCLSGMSYLENECILEPDYWTGYQCLCNFSGCNEKSIDFIEQENDTTTIKASIGKELSVPTTIRRPLNCYGYEIKQAYDPASIPILSNPNGPTTRQSSICRIDGFIGDELGNQTWSAIDFRFTIGRNMTTDSFGFDFDWINSQYFVAYIGTICAYQYDSYGIFTQMLCDWNHCNQFELSMLPKGTVNCHLSAEYNAPNLAQATCLGELCFFKYSITDFNGDEQYLLYNRGCYWQNSTWAQGRIEVGEYNLTTQRILYCSVDYCNFNLTTITAAIKIHKKTPRFIPYRPPIANFSSLDDPGNNSHFFCYNPILICSILIRSIA